jgi:hypothetical protein
MRDINRSLGIMNIPNSVNVSFYIEAKLHINSSIGTNNSSVFLFPPVDNAEAGQVFRHNPAAWDVDGDSLVFKLVPCMTNGTSIAGYTYPPSSGVDPVTGTFEWDSPASSNIGDYSIAIKVEEWRCGLMIGSVMRDMLIPVSSHTNTPPAYIDSSQTIEVEAGYTLSSTILASDPNTSQSISFTGMGGPFMVNAPATFNGNSFQWTPDCSHIREQLYLAVFRVEDNDPTLTLADYSVLQVKVVGQKPQNFTAAPVWGAVYLDWDTVSCGNVIGYALYRQPLASSGNCNTNPGNYTFFHFVTGAHVTDFTDFTNNYQEYCYMVRAV